MNQVWKSGGLAERRHVKNASWIWRESCGDVVSKGLCFIMGRAESLDVWKDSWIPWADGFKPKPKIMKPHWEIWLLLN